MKIHAGAHPNGPILLECYASIRMHALPLMQCFSEAVNMDGASQDVAWGAEMSFHLGVAHETCGNAEIAKRIFEDVVRVSSTHMLCCRTLMLCKLWDHYHAPRNSRYSLRSSRAECQHLSRDTPAFPLQASRVAARTLCLHAITCHQPCRHFACFDVPSGDVS